MTYYSGYLPGGLSTPQFGSFLAQGPGVVDLTGSVDPTGGSACDSTINSAISGLGTKGGVVLLPPNPAGGQASFKCNNPIVLGNGTSSTASTVNGVRLIGTGFPGLGTNNTPQTRLFAGTAMSTLLVIQGPCFGNGAASLYLDPAGQMTNGTMLTVTSGQQGRFDDMLVKVPGGGTGLLSNVVGGGVANQNTMHNKWRGFYVNFANTNTCTAMKWTGAASTYNSCYEDFEDVFIGWGAAASAQTVTAFNFASCDNIRIRGVHCNGVTPVGTNQGAFFDYSVAATNQWPADNLIDGVDWGSASTTFANSGTAPGAGAKPNRIVAISATNGQPANPAITNLSYGYTASNP